MIKMQMFSMLCITSTLVICKTIPVQVIKQSLRSREPYLVEHHVPFPFSIHPLFPKYYLNKHTVPQLPVKYSQIKTVQKSPAKVTLLSSSSQSYLLHPVHHVITEFVPISRIGNNINDKRKLFANKLISDGQYDLNTESSNEDHLVGDIIGRSGLIEENNLGSESDSKESNILDEVTTLHPAFNIETEYTPDAKSYVEERSRLNDEATLNQKFDTNESDTYLKKVDNKLSNKDNLEKYLFKLIYGLSEKESSEECEETSAKEDDSINGGAEASKRLDIFGQTDIYGGESIYEGAGAQVGAAIDGETGTTERVSTDGGAAIDGVIDGNGKAGISDGVDIGKKSSIEVGAGVFGDTDIQGETNVSSGTGDSRITGNNVGSEGYVRAGVNGEENISGQGGIHSDVRISAEAFEGMDISDDTTTNDFTVVNEGAEFQGDANNLEGVSISGATNIFENISKGVNTSEEDLYIQSRSEIDEDVAISGGTQEINHEADIERAASKDGEVSVGSEESYGKGEISKSVGHLTGDNVIISEDEVNDGDASIIVEKSIGEEAKFNKIAGNSEDIHNGNDVFFGGPGSIYRDADNDELTRIYSEVGLSSGTSISDEAGIIHGRTGAKEEVGVDKGSDTDDGKNIDVELNVHESPIIVGKAGGSGGADISTHTAKTGRGLVKIYKTVYVYHN